jgi:hypothetical protein
VRMEQAFYEWNRAVCSYKVSGLAEFVAEHLLYSFCLTEMIFPKLISVQMPSLESTQISSISHS